VGSCRARLYDLHHSGPEVRHAVRIIHDGSSVFACYTEIPKPIIEELWREERWVISSTLKEVSQACVFVRLDSHVFLIDLQAVLALEPKSAAFQMELKDIQQLIAHTAETSVSSRMTGLRAIPDVQDSKEAKADREANEIKLKQRFDRTVKEKFADIESRPQKGSALTRQRSSSADNLCDMHQFEACLKYGLPEPTCPCGEDHDWDDEESDGSYEDYEDDEEEEDYSDIEEEAAQFAEHARARLENAPASRTSQPAHKFKASGRDAIPMIGNWDNSDALTRSMEAAMLNPGHDSFDQLKQ
jgi:hypothetical protein